MSWILLFFAWACLFHVGLTTYVFIVLGQKSTLTREDPFIRFAGRILLYGGQGLFLIAALFTYELFVEGLAEHGYMAISGGTPLQMAGAAGLVVYSVFTVPSALYLWYLEYKSEKAHTH